MTPQAALEIAAASGVAIVVGLPVVAALTTCLATALQPRYRGCHRATRRQRPRPAPAPQRWRHSAARVSRPRHGGVHRRPPRLTIPHTRMSLI